MLKKKQKWASNEQSGMAKASAQTAAAMAQGNADFDAKMRFRCSLNRALTEHEQSLNRALTEPYLNRAS